MRTTLLAVLFSASLPLSAAPARVSLVADPAIGLPAKHGLVQLAAALESQGLKIDRCDSLGRASSPRVVVLARSSDSGILRQLQTAASLPLPAEPEALLVRRLRWNNKDVLLLCGADDRGLMYAALDVAQQIRLSVDLAAIPDIAEKPCVPERGLSKIVMNQSEFESYFFSEDYWSQYLDMLACHRFNNFVLMFGYSSAGYMEPPYPFLFDTEGFPNIRVVGITKVQQQRNLEALRRVVRMTRERGLEFTLALWTHIYRAKQETPGLVYGLTDDNLIPYSQAALKKLLDLVPGIDRIQFRVHVESSLELPQQIPFWNKIFETIQHSGQKIKIDMRVKGFNDDMIDSALSSKLPVRLATKYWGEQMGLPYHPTHVEWRDQYNRRHSYTNLLRYPKRYDMLWRLWNLGTTRILLWGDPEYVRRFSQSTRLYDGSAFEVSEPLAFKMAHHRGPTYSLLTRDYQYYRWEFERYWYFFQVFGRVSYDPDTPSRVWQLEFEKRFGKQAAPPLEQAYAIASRILPRIVAYNLVDLSADRAWAEKQRWGDLTEYINAPPSDTQQFIGIAEAARLHLAGKPDARIWPQQTAEWFRQTAASLQDRIRQAEQAGVPATNKEFVSTLIDMKVLANLALYHSQRIPAGFDFALFNQTQDLHALNETIRFQTEAIRHWQEIVKLTGGVYHDNLIMGRGPLLTGHWKDELTLLEKELADLKQRQAKFRPEFRKLVASYDFGSIPRTQRYSYQTGGYGWLSASLFPSPTSTRGPGFAWGPPSNQYTQSAFLIDLPNGYYELRFAMQDTSEQPRDHGPMWIEAEGRNSTKPFVVPAGKRLEEALDTQVTNGRLGINFNSATPATWLVNSLVITRVEPSIAHVPVRYADPAKPLQIRATVGGPASLKAVRLVYGSAQQGYRSTPMKRPEPFLYAAVIPPSALTQGLTYFIEVEDFAGRLVRSDPVEVSVSADHEPPVVTHKKIEQATAREPLTLEATAVDPSGVKAVVLRYRGVNQHQEFASLPMLPTGAQNGYVAQIPAAHIDPRWDLMYFIEAFDTQGNAKIYPDLERETPYVVVRLRR